MKGRLNQLPRSAVCRDSAKALEFEWSAAEPPWNGDTPSSARASEAAALHSSKRHSSCRNESSRTMSIFRIRSKRSASMRSPATRFFTRVAAKEYCGGTYELPRGLGNVFFVLGGSLDGCGASDECFLPRTYVMFHLPFSKCALAGP